MAKFRVYLKNKNPGEFEGFSQVKTIEAENEEEAESEARKLEKGGYKIFRIEKLVEK